MNEERAKELLRKVKEGSDPTKTKYSIEEVKAKIGWLNTSRLIRSWSPKAKGKRAFFEIEEIRKKKYLSLISEVERRLMNIEGFGRDIKLPIVWKRIRLEEIKTGVRLKRHGWYLTILSIVIGVVATYLATYFIPYLLEGLFK